MNIFKFRPIGQGLFYTGSINDGEFNFVYDCGTDSSCQHLEEAVRMFAYELSEARNESVAERDKPELDFVVISHLHKDHINGFNLLNHYFKIKKVYLPYLRDDNTTLLYLACNLLRDGDLDENMETFEFISRYYIREYSNETEVVYLTANNLDTEVTEYGDFRYFIKQFGLHGWNFYLVNKQIGSGVLAALYRRVSYFLRKENITDVRSYLLNCGYEEIKRIYEEIFKSNKLNATSTLLLHFPVQEVFADKSIYEASVRRHFHLFCPECLYYPRYNKTYGITLLTGDAEFDDEINRLLKQILQNRPIDVLQIPHHGSKNNWSKLKKYNYCAHNYVIPYGLGNKYKHPSSLVIDELVNRMLNFYCATQQYGFDYILYI